jgi:hypothetical protein
VLALVVLVVLLTRAAPVFDLAANEATVERFNGCGVIRVYYATFETKTAGMPFMATLLSSPS